MRARPSISILPALLVMLATFAAATPVAAQQLRWRSETGLPKPLPPPAPPPAVLERAPSATAYGASANMRTGGKTCGDNRACVVCVAA